MLNNKIKAILALVMISLFVVGCSSNDDSGSEGEEVDKIKVAYHPHLVGLGALIAAEENDYFSDENLEVELIEFTSGSTELQAMASGDIDLGYLGVGAHVFAPQGEAEIISIDSTDISSEIMVRADSGIETIDDLKDKTVAISSGTTSDLALSLAIENSDLTEDDIEKVDMDASAKVTSFMTDKVDAVAMESPYTDQIRKDLGEDEVVTIQSSEDFLPEAVFTNSWAATPKYLEDNEDVTVRFLKALVKGIDYRYNNMEESIELTADYLNEEPEVIGQLEDKTNWLSASDIEELYEDGTVNEWYDKMIDMFTEADLLDEEYAVSSDEYVIEEYLMQAIEELKDEGALD